jgi:hypothetical protein
MMEATPVKLKLDEENSLTFEVTLEGEIRGDPDFRLVCDRDEMALAFQGARTDEGVMFRIPPMKGMLKEGSHNAHLEVIVGDRLLIPMRLDLDFRPGVKASVASVRVKDQASPSLRVETKLVQHDQPSKPKAEPKAEASAQQSGRKHLTLKEIYDLKRKKR